MFFEATSSLRCLWQTELTNGLGLVDSPSNVLNFLEIRMNPPDVLDETIFSNSGEKKCKSDRSSKYANHLKN